MIKLPIKQTSKKNKLIEREWYRNAVTHFSVISGILTIIGLIYGIVSYHQTVKPLVDEKRLKEQVVYLKEQNTDLVNTNESLFQEKSNIEQDLNSLNLKREMFEREIKDKEKKLLNLKDEVILANADAFMSPIIYELMYSSIHIAKGENQYVKEQTLKKLNEELDGNISETQRRSIDLLKQYVQEKIDEHSIYSDLFGYRVYIYQQNLKDMSITLDQG